MSLTQVTYGHIEYIFTNQSNKGGPIKLVSISSSSVIPFLYRFKGDFLIVDDVLNAFQLFSQFTFQQQKPAPVLSKRTPERGERFFQMYLDWTPAGGFKPHLIVACLAFSSFLHKYSVYEPQETYKA